MSLLVICTEMNFAIPNRVGVGLNKVSEVFTWRQVVSTEADQMVP